MKFILASVAALVSSTAAFAGSVTYVAPEVEMVEEPARMGGSGSWLIPIVILAVIALALTNNDSSEKEPEG